MAKAVSVPKRRSYPIDLKVKTLQEIDTGKTTIPEACKRLDITPFQLKTWRAQIPQGAMAIPEYSGSDSTQDVMARLIRDVADGKIGDTKLRLAIFDLIVRDIRQEK